VAQLGSLPATPRQAQVERGEITSQLPSITDLTTEIGLAVGTVRRAIDIPVKRAWYRPCRVAAPSRGDSGVRSCGDWLAGARSGTAFRDLIRQHVRDSRRNQWIIVWHRLLWLQFLSL
jgi:hypothetical protein